MTETAENAVLVSNLKPPHRVLILANPQAGKLSRVSAAAELQRTARKFLDQEARRENAGSLPLALPLLAEMAAQAGLCADVEPIVAPDKLPERMRLAAAEGYDTVAAAGGDGTARSVAQALLGSELRLGVIPVGTANNIARSLRVPFDTLSALGVIAAGNERRVDVGRVGGATFLEGAGVGMFADAIAAIGGEELRPRQLLRILRVLGPLWWRPQVRSLRLTLDGAAQSEQALMVVIANTAYLGEGIPIAPQARLDDGLFDVVIVREMSRWELAVFACSALRGDHLTLPQVHRTQARTAEIHRVHPRLRPLPIHADDHIAAHTPARFEVMPAALRVFAPPEALPAQIEAPPAPLLLAAG